MVAYVSKAENDRLVSQAIAMGLVPRPMTATIADLIEKQAKVYWRCPVRTHLRYSLDRMRPLRSYTLDGYNFIHT
ncbi:hypothetical protein QOZ96_003498 [Brevundimonas nasdae]|nr:hypothetical protein [Brevundimonas nasdae]